MSSLLQYMTQVLDPYSKPNHAGRLLRVRQTVCNFIIKGHFVCMEIEL